MLYGEEPVLLALVLIWVEKLNLKVVKETKIQSLPWHQIIAVHPQASHFTKVPHISMNKSWQHRSGSVTEEEWPT
jgi:hypothetical protein